MFVLNQKNFYCVNQFILRLIVLLGMFFLISGCFSKSAAKNDYTENILSSMPNPDDFDEIQLLMLHAYLSASLTINSFNELISYYGNLDGYVKHDVNHVSSKLSDKELILTVEYRLNGGRISVESIFLNEEILRELKTGQTYNLNI